MALSRFSMTSLCIVAVVSCTATPVPSVAPIIATPAIAAIAETPAPAPRTDFWLRDDPIQGGLAVGRAPEGAVSVTLNGTPVAVAQDGFFLLGFDRDAENSASLVATLADGKKVERYLPVRPGNWRIEHVNASPTGGAKTSEEFQARRGAELAQINDARSAKSESAGWRQDFIWPIEYWTYPGGRLSGFFGAQRIYNGTPGSYHSGMDIAAATGRVYVAPADGVVTLAAKSPFTLEGYLLMIDHGMGLNSAFLHSSELLVEVGQVVKQGQPLGKVGATGRASGPHLHWGMKWNAARVDPLLLVPKR